MRESIHPSYEVVDVNCACGITFQTRSTKSNGKVSVEICSLCHPFFTGKQKIVDTEGRVDRFQQRFGTFQRTK
jgi:large subunit ribosomal protein L31